MKVNDEAATSVPQFSVRLGIGMALAQRGAFIGQILPVIEKSSMVANLDGQKPAKTPGNAICLLSELGAPYGRALIGRCPLYRICADAIHDRILPGTVDSRSVIRK